MKRELTCIVCPIGCQLTVELEEGKVRSVSGNTCPRGKAYAEAECIAPMRTLTTTVRCKGGKLLPVKTDRPIPKEKLFAAMEMVNNIHPTLPISQGDVIIKEIFGAQLVATGNGEE
jgi:CxxC motif-containing protein